jgi:predicted DsbA family dithiol-disulfide isomerase
LHWAGVLDAAAGPGSTHQHRLKAALLQAYHGDGHNPGDPAVLLQLVANLGLDETAAAEVLASGRYADEVHAAERHWQRLGIHSVPAVVVNGRHLIQGGQPPEVFEQALRQIAAAP